MLLMNWTRTSPSARATRAPAGWKTTTSLLFLGAKGHCITAGELQILEARFGRRTVKACKTILEHFHTRAAELRPEFVLRAIPFLP